MITNPTLGETGGRVGSEFIGSFVNKLTMLGLVVGTLFFFFMIIVGAIQWINSGGDKGAVEASRSKISNALVGIFILFGLFAVLNFVGAFFGFESIFTLDIGSLVIQ